MNKIKLQLLWYPEDCKRIQAVFFRMGYDVSLMQAQEMWSNYSDTLAASWLFLPKDDEEILERLEPYWEREE